MLLATPLHHRLRPLDRTLQMKAGAGWVPVISCLPYPSPSGEPLNPPGSHRPAHSHRACLPVAHGLMGNTMAATALDPTATARLSPGKAKGLCLPQITGWALKLKPGSSILPREKPKPTPSQTVHPPSPPRTTQGRAGSLSPPQPEPHPCRASPAEFLASLLRAEELRLVPGPWVSSLTGP